MSKLLLVAAFLAATALAADAQQALPNFVPPAAGMPIPLPPVNAGGITEQGRGVVSLAADRLRLTVRIYGMAPVPPVARPAAPVTDLDAAYKDAIAIMRANGIPDAHFVSPLLGSLTNNDQITGTIAKPTSDKLAAIERRIVGALPPSIVGVVRNVNVMGSLEVDDCGTALDRARASAFADARKRAEALAGIAGVRLGTLLTANESDQSFGCVGTNAFTPYFAGGNDAVLKSNVDITVYVNATFAIRPS